MKLFKCTGWKKWLFVLLTIMICNDVLAGHIAGGEMYYNYVGPGDAANTNKYQITLRLFRECNPVGTAAQLPDEVELGIFHTGTSSLNAVITVPQTSFQVISLQKPLTCIINPPQICYQVATYTFTYDFAQTPDGYTISYQTCCRSYIIVNVQTYMLPGANTPGEGATFSCTIPGTNTLAEGTNSSAVFNLKDTVLVCTSKPINLNFSANDPDGDSLSYQFCAAYNRGNAENSGNVIPSAPPYQEVTYSNGFSGGDPLGSNIVIDPKTGVITGTMPASSSSTSGYVITVCVYEWRKGQLIDIHRKDFMLRVTNCDFAAADIPVSIIDCSAFTQQFQNGSTSSAIHSYYWDFGDPESSNNISDSSTPTHTFSDSGTYKVKLVVNRGEQCTDSAISAVSVYPGFVPAFNIKGSCILNPYQFIDQTISRYGVVNKWSWNFGDVGNSIADTSVLQNPVYTYSKTQTTTVTFTVADNKGCSEQVSKQLVIDRTPQLTLPFKDTLICVLDTLLLQSSTTDLNAVFSWSPLINISRSNTGTPTVAPKDTTTYYVTITDKGCIGKDSIIVNVIQYVIINAGNDTTICTTDAIQLYATSNALHYLWSPSTYLNNPYIQNPTAIPLQNITYTVTGTVGKCTASDDIFIKTVPYPIANAGPDTFVCYGKTTELQASMQAAYFQWSPTISLLNYNTLTPIAGPESTTSYILRVNDTLGCPKTVADTVVVTVIPPVPAFAGNDTTIVVGEPLQLNATGGVNYAWTPSTGMNNPFINNPVVTLNTFIDSITYLVKVSTREGCYAYDSLTVFMFKTKPDIFIPSAFTPNGDGMNDILKPVPVGIKQFNFFRVYNRWGNLLYSTSTIGAGWDGTFGGKLQQSETYVYVAQGIDYTGKLITKKGTVVLIR
jgi:gliding motility-associated-like protein